MTWPKSTHNRTVLFDLPHPMDPTRELIQIRISGWAKHLICGFGITGYTLYRKGGLCDWRGRIMQLTPEHEAAIRRIAETLKCGRDPPCHTCGCENVGRDKSASAGGSSNAWRTAAAPACTASPSATVSCVSALCESISRITAWFNAVKSQVPVCRMWSVQMGSDVRTSLRGRYPPPPRLHAYASVGMAPHRLSPAP